MFNSTTLFRERLSAHVKELSRYLRYILNGHTAIAMVFLISVLAVYYQQWLAQLSPSFPAPAIIAVLFGLLASFTPINTLLKEPDLVFITVSEKKMLSYFRSSLIYSFIVQLYLVFLVVAALGPLYFHAFPERSGRVYLFTLLILLIIKVWNLIIYWLMLKVRHTPTRIIHHIIRSLLTIGLFYYLIIANYIFASIFTVALFIAFIVDYIISAKNVGINWELLIEKDRNQKQFFYRMASMFVDVPHLKSRVKRRKLLTSVVNNKIPFQQKKTYNFLYWLTFLRSGDYLQMYIRLIIIGSLFVYFIPNDLLKLTFSILFIYMSNFQMISLYHHHRMIVWLDLYPVPYKNRLNSFLSLLVILTAIQTGIFAIIFVLQFDIVFAILSLIIGTTFNVLFNFKYVKGKINEAGAKVS